MPSDHRLASLAEIAVDVPNAIAAGPFGSNLVSRDYVESGVPVIRGQNLVGRWLAGDFVYVSEVKAHQLRANTARPGDIVFTQRGTLGQVSVVPTHPFRSYVVSQSQMKLTVDRRKADPRFVYYACTSSDFVAQVLNNAVAAGVPHINLGILRGLRVPLPTMSRQVEVADILSSLDDRIDLLRQANVTLESIARVLFKSWFIDFDPVRAKVEGREPEGMDAATAALFPAEFEESSLGLIPKGWRAGSLSELADLNARSWTTRRAPTEIAYVDLAGVKCNVFDTPQRYMFVDAPSRARRELRVGDTLVGTVRPGNRSFGFIAQSELGLTGSTGFAVLSPRDAVAAPFIYLCATRDENIERLSSLADGGAYPAVRPELVLNTSCTLPPDVVITAFSSIAEPLMNAVAANTARARVFAELRDTLLPRLISGRLRLPEAREQMEEVLA